MAMHDSGERQSFATGAVRDTAEGKGRFDLLSPFALFRLARWVELGSKKYEDRNWEKGINMSRCYSSAVRHLNMWMLGMDVALTGDTTVAEDHLAAAMTNIMFMMHFEATKPELMDVPRFDYRRHIGTLGFGSNTTTSATTTAPASVDVETEMGYWYECQVCHERVKYYFDEGEFRCHCGTPNRAQWKLMGAHVHP